MRVMETWHGRLTADKRESKDFPKLHLSASLVYPQNAICNAVPEEI